MIGPRLRTIVFAAVATLGLSACYEDGYGYGGLSVGYGSAGYYDPYYAGGYGAPYWGWYDNFYYPGTGFFVYDRFGSRHRWNDRHRHYWEGRRHAWRGDVRDRWDGFRGDRRWDGRRWGDRGDWNRGDWDRGDRNRGEWRGDRRGWRDGARTEGRGWRQDRRSDWRGSRQGSRRGRGN
jgi:hypothetical protein